MLKRLAMIVLLLTVMFSVVTPAAAYVAGSGSYFNGEYEVCYEYGYEWNEYTFLWDFWYNQWPC